MSHLNDFRLSSKIRQHGIIQRIKAILERQSFMIDELEQKVKEFEKDLDER